MMQIKLKLEIDYLHTQVVLELELTGVDFMLMLTFYFSGGNKIYERWNWYSQATGLSIYSDYYQGAASLMDRWQQPGDITNVPRMRYSTSTELEQDLVIRLDFYMMVIT